MFTLGTNTKMFIKNDLHDQLYFDHDLSGFLKILFLKTM